MELLLVITYALLFIRIIQKMPFFDIKGISKKTISGIFILKIIFGLCLWAIYTFYYTDRAAADIYKYFDDSAVIFNALKSNPADYFKMLLGIGNNTPAFDHYYSEMHYWARKAHSSIYNDSHTIIRFNAFLRIFSFGYYNVHTVVICFLSLAGLTAIYKTFSPHLGDKKNELIFVIFLLPSVLFWGSGVLKEGLIFFALGFLIYYSGKLFSVRSICICIAAAILLALSKFYIWIALFPGLLFLILVNSTNTKNLSIKFFAVLIVTITIGLNIDSFSAVQNPLVTLSQKQLEFSQLASGSLKDANGRMIPAAGSIIKINKLEPSIGSFIKNSPDALKNTMLRPYIWESRSPMILLSALETVFILSTLLFCLIFMKPWQKIKWEYFLFCFSFAIIQFLIIGETTPVMGAIVRYKTIALPFLLTAFLFILDKEKVLKKFPFYSKIFFRKK